MTAPRPYRAGLGLPDAIIIRSGPAPTPENIPTTTSTDIGGIGSLGPPLPKEQAWREWVINPAKHGPERMKGPPVFVPSQGSYDELGRSTLHGVGVDIDEGKRIQRIVEDGGSVAEWYANLSRGNSRVASGAVTPTSGQAEPSRLQNQIIDLTGDDDEDKQEEKKPITTGDSGPRLSVISETAPSAPHTLRVDKKEWFIRRALLSRSQSSPQPPSIPARPTSIGSMVNLDTPSTTRINLPQYVLGPTNKGYELLKDRLGWEGGGLGRPEGWNEAGPSRLSLPEDPAPREPTVLKDEDGREITDLTIETDSEEDEEEFDLPDVARMGPGRTAPISTALKLDRLGIGHIRATRTRNGESTKKVTHSHKEILEAQRRAKYAGRPMQGLELGKKGKTKWKDKDRKERDERRRLAAALNA